MKIIPSQVFRVSVKAPLVVWLAICRGAAARRLRKWTWMFACRRSRKLVRTHADGGKAYRMKALPQIETTAWSRILCLRVNWADRNLLYRWVTRQPLGSRRTAAPVGLPCWYFSHPHSAPAFAPAVSKARTPTTGVWARRRGSRPCLPAPTSPVLPVRGNNAVRSRCISNRCRTTRTTTGALKTCSRSSITGWLTLPSCVRARNGLMEAA